MPMEPQDHKKTRAGDAPLQTTSLYSHRGEEDYHSIFDQDQLGLDKGNNFDDDFIDGEFSRTETIHTNYASSKRSKYSAKIDRFLNNGMIIVAVLLLAVLLIAFLV